jgi:predicted SAM-dependent methyltransferase
MLNHLKKFVPQSMRGIIRAFSAETCNYFMHAQGLLSAGRFKNLPDLKLNCGCGKNTKDGWVNIDMYPGADLCLDLRKPLPFKPESVSIVYSEHFFEHLEYPDEAMSFLHECLRVLVPGGVCHVVVPDFRKLMQAYLDDDELFFQHNAEWWRPTWAETPIECLNVLVRGGHHFCYDFNALARALNYAGFDSVARRSMDPLIDSPSRELESLYVTAVKPLIGACVGEVNPK